MKSVFVVLTILAINLTASDLLFAHCDTMNGPVVTAAKRALETGNVNLVLIWVQPGDESAIKAAFDKTSKMLSLSPEVKEMAQMYFFETLVRIHRAGEGEPYTGLKPADTEVDPGIEAADQAIEQGAADSLLRQLHDTVDNAVSKHFKEVVEARGYDKNDLSAGRLYVKNYVTFIHYVEGVYAAAMNAVREH